MNRREYSDTSILASTNMNQRKYYNKINKCWKRIRYGRRLRRSRTSALHVCHVPLRDGGEKAANVGRPTSPYPPAWAPPTHSLNFFYIAQAMRLPLLPRTQDKNVPVSKLTSHRHCIQVTHFKINNTHK
jgi:hypothetical protein